MPCVDTYDQDTDTYSYDCNTETTDDSAGLATVWIIVIVALIAKAVFWILVCYFCHRRRRRVYVIGHTGVQVTSCSAQTTTTPACAQGASAPAIPIAQPLSSAHARGTTGMVMRTVDPPSYSEHVKGHAQGENALLPTAPGHPGAYIPEAAATVPQEQPEEEPVVSDRVRLLANY